MKGIIEIVNMRNDKLLCMSKTKYHYFDHAWEEFENFCNNNTLSPADEICAVLLYKGSKTKDSLISYATISPGYAIKLVSYFTT